MKQVLIGRLLAKASETDQGGRYYNRTLDEIDRMSLVRDRGRSRQAEEDVDEDEEEIEEEEEKEDKKLDIKDDKPKPELNEKPDTDLVRETPKTDRQHALEAEWGLYRSPNPSQKVDDEDEEETDDERRKDTFRSTEVEEDFMVGPFPFFGLRLIQ
jgi:DNA ligase-4